MVFSSSIFLLYFLPIFLLVYNLVGRKLKNYVLLAASVFFYAWGAPKFVFVIIASTVIDFYVVKKLHQSEAEKTRKQLLLLSITLNLGLLVFFKYSNFFVDNVNGLLQSFGAKEIPWLKVALPIGISFYTFQTLTYAIDIYRRESVPLKKLTDYLLYILSFPQMIAGPIVRFNSVAKQITSRIETDNYRLLGFYRFCIGLAKKVLIANVMGEQADVYMSGNFQDLEMAQAWVGIIAFTFQIYFDFSGYSDMAIGLGKMMGFTFPENFNSPYTSKNISEFWRRWHITLGGFMRDYLYIPLGGNRVSSKSRLYFNLWFVFFLSGLWHGASWNYILWGVYHGFFLILDRLFLVKLFKRLGNIPSVVFTFFLVVIGWVIFKIEDATQIPIYISKLFDFSTIQAPKTIPAFYKVGIVAAIFSFITLSKWGKKLEHFIFQRSEYNWYTHIILALMSVLFLIVSISSVSSSGFNPFIYYRF